MELATSLVRWVFARLPSLLTSWYMTPARFSSWIELEVRARGDQVSLWCSNPSSAQVWLTVQNGAPVTVTLDRVRIEIHQLGEWWGHERVEILPGRTEEFLVRGLYGMDFDRLLPESGDVDFDLSLTGYLDSKARAFVVSRSNLQGVHTTVVNRSEPSLTSEPTAVR